MTIHSNLRNLGLRMFLAAGIPVIVGLFFPPLLPLAVFAMSILLFGIGMVGFFLSVCAGLAMAFLYPHIFGWHAYNHGDKAVSLEDLVVSEVDSTIIGLLLLNAFFVVGVENRYFKCYALPMIRQKIRMLRSRLLWGVGLGAIGFCDDAAAGGLLNRLYLDDIASPGVSEVIKRKMLILILLLANAFAAVIPLSSWTIFYYKVRGDFPWFQSGYLMLPWVFIFFCLWMALDSNGGNKGAGVPRLDGKVPETNRKKLSVLPVDFMRCPEPPPCGITGWVFLLILLFPLLLSIGLLAPGIIWRVEGDLIISFGAGLVAQLVVVTGLMCFEHYWRPGANSFIPHPRQSEAMEALHASDRALEHLRADLVAGPSERGGPVANPHTIRTLGDLHTVRESIASARATGTRIPQVEQRLHPAIRPSKPLCWKASSIWEFETSKLLESGVLQMVQSLLRVVLILILAKATMLCMGMPLAGAESAEKTGGSTGIMFENEGALIYMFFEILSNFGIGMLSLFAMVIALLVALKWLGLSSAWGVLSIVFPLTMVFLTGLSGEITGAQMDLVTAVIFGLIVSFGVWCNVVLPTGDSVEITSQIQGLASEELCVITWRIALFPLIATSAGLFLLFLFSSHVASFPSWVKWGALPFGWALAASFFSYRYCRKWIHDEK